MRSRLTVAGVVTGLALLTLAGCGSDGGKSSTISDGGGAAPANGANQDSAEGKARAAAPGPAAANAPTTSNRVTIQRSRILTADLTVRAKNAKDVGSIAEKAIALVIGAGGDVAGDKRNQDGSRTEAAVILKVPTAKYTDTLKQLADLGDEVGRTSTSQDVTDEVVDVSSRISSQTASVERVRKLLASAKNLGDIVTIEGELAKRQADLESLKARQRALDAQTADATITLHVLAPDAAVAKKKEEKKGFLAGLDAGWTAFTASVTVLLTVLGALLPFLVVLAIPLIVLMVLLRRRRPARRAANDPAVATPSP